MEAGPLTRALKAEQENRELRDKLAVEEKRVERLQAAVERLSPILEPGIPVEDSLESLERWAGTD